jgi:hypothetical protein
MKYINHDTSPIQKIAELHKKWNPPDFGIRILAVL